MAAQTQDQEYCSLLNGKIICTTSASNGAVNVSAVQATDAGVSRSTALTKSAQTEDDDPQERIESIRAIYNVLSKAAKHSNIVEYLGQSGDGFQLERLHLGPLPQIWPTLAAAQDDAARGKILALYRGWALDLLSAMTHMHSLNIVLNQLLPEMLWLREDFSLAIAVPHAAGCTDPPIRGEVSWSPTWQINSQWYLYSQYRLFTDGPRWLDDEKCSPSQLAGDPKIDLFNWATLMYHILMPGDSPIEQALYQVAERAYDPGRFKKEVDRRLHQINRGRNKPRYWPKLPHEMLGTVLKKCWTGQYTTSQEALRDAEATIEQLVNGGQDLGTGAIRWQEELEVVKDDHGTGELRFRENR